VIVIAGDDSNVPWALLALLILPAALLGYAAVRARERTRRPPVPLVQGHPGRIRLTATPVYDRPVHTLRVIGRREPAGPRIDIRDR